MTGTRIKQQIPWLVMTSDATDTPTQKYFEEKAFFGLEKSQASSLCFLFVNTHLYHDLSHSTDKGELSYNVEILYY